MMRGFRPNRRRTGRKLPRHGVVTLEFILAASIWFFTMLAIFELGFLMLTLQVGHTALVEGTRKAAELYPPAFPFDAPGSDDDLVDQVVQVLNEHLGVHCVEVPDTANGLPDTTDGNARVIVRRLVGGGAVETADRGDATIPCTSTVSDADIRDDEVVVTLCIRLVDPVDPTGCGNPVPDWLSTFGFSLDSCIFEVTSRTRLE